MVDAVSNALSGLKLNALKVSVAASNIVNIGSTGPVTPEPNGRRAYTPKDVVAIAQQDGGVSGQVIDRTPATVKIYDPGSIDADANGLMAIPNIELATEAVTLMIAKNAYAASASVIRTADKMEKDLLSLLDQKT